MRTPCLTLALTGAVLLAMGCDKPTADSSLGQVVDAPEGMRPEAYAAVAPTVKDTPTAILGATQIPYPVYPNGSKYRVGGENGLKIVVYQTDDDFAAVDDYYRQATDPAGMPRLEAMQDFVRYSRAASDDDPWATDRPGIVIHEFGTDTERRAVGARASARTNIILSF